MPRACKPWPKAFVTICATGSRVCTCSTGVPICVRTVPSSVGATSRRSTKVRVVNSGWPGWMRPGAGT